ncbi:endopeptidase [Streptococcus phage Javan249]|uniref:gp58-like family protein n=1 Tax=Streptococcus halotolerans TaxID=1814128 RepID=UPI0007880C2D|nr:gp58-like family protein [Streptococcus halotolerans]QBX16410.1 endopeptidase [Streptococcus phage Javan249]
MYTFLDQFDNEYGAIATIEVTNAVNGERSIKGDIYSNDTVLNNLDKGWRLRFQDEYFVIVYAKPKDLGDKIQLSFDAVHQFFWDFSKKVANEQLKDGSHTFETYLNFIFKDTDYRFNLEENVKAFEKQSFGYKSKLALFNDIISASGLEFQVNGKVVRILEKTGTDLSTVVRKNFNMNELTIEKHIDGFITYQKGFGKWHDPDDHSKGRLEVEYESPLAKEFGRLEGEPVVDERYTDTKSLLSRVRQNVEDSYIISVQIDLEDLTRADYHYKQPIAGDYIMAINETLGFQEKLRIVSFTSQYDSKGTLISHKVTCNDLGSVKKQSTSYTKLSKSVTAANEQVQGALITANKALVTADGKNTAYFGTEFPLDNPKGSLTKGDIFYRKVGDRTLMYFWNGSDWEDNPVLNDVESFKRDIDSQFKTVTETMQRNDAEHQKGIDDLLAKAGVNKSLAEEAKRIGNQAKLDAANALSKALDYKNEAITEAQRLDTVEREATETKLATAKSQAVAEANKLVETAKSLLNDQVSGVSTDLNQTKEAIKLLATKTSVDDLTGRISSAESSLKVQANQIASRVKTSDFDQAKERLSTAESSITQLGNRITTEISETVAKIPSEIGTRNYFRGYKYNEEITLNSYQGVGSFTQFYDRITYNLSESDGKTFTISFEAISPNGETPLEIYNRNENPQYFNFASRRIGIIGNTWHKFTRTVTVSTQTISNSTNSNRLEIYAPSKTGVKVRNIKVELGDVATDWSPAPEDMVSEIENVKTTITQTAEGQEQLSTRLTETQGKVSSAETKITQLIGNVSSKVSQTDFDNVKKIIQNNSTSITQNQNAINLKADKTVTDRLAQSVEQTKADLKITSDAVATKVSKSDFDATTQRLNSAETIIQAQAGQIEQRLTRTQVEQAITSKGYATNTTVQNLVKETTDGFERKISRVESKIPTDYDNQNLWIKSKSSGYSAVEKLPDNHITQQSECYRLNNGTQLIFNIEPEYSARLYRKVTFSAWVKYSDVVRGDNFWNVFNCFKHVIYRRNSKTGAESSVDYTTPRSFEGTSDWKYISFTLDYSTQTQYDQLKTSLAFRMENAASGTAWVTGVKVEIGDRATRYSLAVEDTITVTEFNEVKDTVDSHTRTIGDMRGNIGSVAMTASGLLARVSSAETDLSTVQSQLAGSWAVRNLTSSGTVLNQLNLNRDGSVKIDGKLVQITGTTYIQDGVITSAKIANLDAAKITTGTLNAANVNIVNLNANKLVGLDANFIRSKIELAMIDWMKGKTITAQNNAMRINLNDGQLLYYTDQAAMKRVLDGYPNQFVKFATGEVTGKGRAGVTVIGSNRYGTESSDDGGFVGIRAWNGSIIDKIDVVGDKVHLASSAFESADGWEVITLPNKLTIDAYNINHRVSSRVKVGDVWLWKNSTTYSSVKDTLNLIIDNLVILHNNKTTAKDYSYTLPGKI